MRRQNPQTLNERKCQHQQHNDRNALCGVSPLAGHEHHWGKKDHGADHRKQYRLKNLPDAPQRGLITLDSSRLRGMNRLTDDDGIVHDDTEHQQKGE